MDRNRAVDPKHSNHLPVAILSSSTEETIAHGRAFAKRLKVGDTVCFFGDLGAGKTTFIKGLVELLTGVHNPYVCSPTFSYLNIYDGLTPVHHFDLYRLNDEEAFLSMGFEEFFGQGICCLEWSERIPTLIPDRSWLVTLRHLGEELREITYEVSAR